jgi:hypothetical protein
MSNLRKYLPGLVILLFVFCTSFALTPQEKEGQLFFSEVYLDSEQTGNSWVEIHNPTDTSLMLQRFRISHIKTINILPDSIQQLGGIEVKANEFLILCADKSLFNKTGDIEIKPIVVKELTMIGTGGFMALTTKSSKNNLFDTFRYGDPDKSAYAEDLRGDQVLDFLKNGNSYSRVINFKYRR